MKITIAPLAQGARAVAATFEHEGVTHTRDVNACFVAGGGYDEAATAARIEEVALGVEQKIALGVIANAPATDSADQA